MKITALIAAAMLVVSVAHANHKPGHKGTDATTAATTTTTTTGTATGTDTAATGTMDNMGDMHAATAKNCKTLKGKEKKMCMQNQKAAAAPTGETKTK